MRQTPTQQSGIWQTPYAFQKGTAKAADPSADTSEQAAETDRLVSRLYGLAEDEITAEMEKS